MMSGRLPVRGASGARGLRLALGEQFSQAAAAGRASDRDIILAGKRLRLRFAGSGHESFVMAALDHREVAVWGVPDLTVSVWDSATTGTFEFELPSAVPAAAPKVEVFGRDGSIFFAMCVSTRMLSVLDIEKGSAFCWIPDAGDYPWSHRASPLKTIIHWWYGSRGMPLVHAAAVALGETGALLPGASGSGKSTTALTCRNGPLRMLSDDLCLLEPGRSPRLHGIYRTARVAASDLHRFKGIRTERQDPPGRDGKAIIHLEADEAEEGERGGAEVRAILVPIVTRSPRARLVPISSSAALKALAPSTIFQFPGDQEMRARTLEELASIARAAPAYRLELGAGIDSVRRAVEDVLSKASP